MSQVDVTNPVPPSWYEPSHDLGKCIELVRNGNAVFWKIELPNGHPDYGLFLPGSGYTPSGATLYAPPAGEAGESLPGLPQHSPADPDYPVVKTGAVLVNLSGSGISFHVG